MTHRYVLDTDPNRHFFLLICLYGIALSINSSSSMWIKWLSVMGVFFRPAQFSVSSGFLITLFMIAVILLGILVSLGSLYMKALLISMTSYWIGCQGTFRDLRAVVAWSTVPKIALLIISIPILLIQKKTMPADTTASQTLYAYLFHLANTGTTI